MKKAIIYLFTGSGNTLKIANCFKNELLAFDIDVTIYSLKKDITPPDPNNFDIAGFGFPIHAFNAPEVFVKMAKNLPKTQNKQAFVFKVGGEPLWLNNSSSFKLNKILAKKGFVIGIDKLFVMPYNMIFRHNDNMARHMWIYAQALAKAYAKDIADFKKEKINIPLFKRTHSTLLRIEWGFAKINGKLFRVNKKKCISCGKCYNICPVNNIVCENGKIKFKSYCIMCTRCSFNCPTNAINIGILNAWKVNGDYHLASLEKNENIKFPFISNETKGAYKLYKKYYSNADKVLKEKGIALLY